MAAAELRYLALGDSYTIGTGASEPGRCWVGLVAERLQGASGRPVSVVNQAVNGFTADDVIAAELHLVRERSPELVSVLVGANDVVRGRSEAGYAASLGVIYDEVAVLRLPPGRVAAVSVPDFSLSPWARPYGTGALRARIDAVNSIARAEAAARGFAWVDISEVSRSGAASPGWFAEDGLHPSDAQYAAWAEAIWSSWLA